MRINSKIKNMKNKILHVCKYYSPDEGGIETVAKYLVEGLKEFENVVVCFSTDGRSHIDIVNGIEVHRIAPLFKALAKMFRSVICLD